MNNTKTYSFECYDEKARSTVKIEFSTDNDTWMGCDGPMFQFFSFLKGCGFVFDINTMIGVIDENCNFHGAVED